MPRVPPHEELQTNYGGLTHDNKMSRLDLVPLQILVMSLNTNFNEAAQGNNSLGQLELASSQRDHRHRSQQSTNQVGGTGHQISM
jgi:hypothetical protein